MTKPKPMPMVGYRLPRVLIRAIQREAKARQQTPSQYVRDMLLAATVRRPHTVTGVVNPIMFTAQSSQR